MKRVFCPAIAVIIIFSVLTFELILWLGWQNQEKGQEILQLESDKVELAAQVNIINELADRYSRVPPSPQGTTGQLDLGVFSAVADTGSMEPVLNGTTKVVLVKEPVSIGDIAVYDSGTDTVAHRIVGETSNGMWIFRGDNSNGTEFVPKSKVLWRVKAIIY